MTKKQAEIIEAGCKLVGKSGSKVSANTAPSSIRCTLAEMSEIRPFENAAEVAEAVGFIRRNRELSTTSADAGMVQFFTDAVMVTVGIDGRKCREALDLFKAGKSWKDRKPAAEAETAAA